MFAKCVPVAECWFLAPLAAGRCRVQGGASVRPLTLFRAAVHTGPAWEHPTMLAKIVTNLGAMKKLSNF